MSEVAAREGTWGKSARPISARDGALPCVGHRSVEIQSGTGVLDLHHEAPKIRYERRFIFRMRGARFKTYRVYLPLLATSGHQLPGKGLQANNLVRIAVLQGVPEGLGCDTGLVSPETRRLKYKKQTNLVQGHISGIDGAVGQSKYCRREEI